MNKRYKQFLTTIGSMGLLAVIFDIFPTLMRSIDYFLQSKQLNVGTVLMMMVPFFMILNGLGKEKEKRIQAKLIERRQLQIAFNLNEILEALKVESKWSIQEISSSRADPRSLKRLHLLSRVVTILRRKKLMEKLKSRKLWMAIFGALLPIINKEFNLGLNSETVIASVGAIVAYILGQAHVDSKSAQKTANLDKLDDGPAV